MTNKLPLVFILLLVIELSACSVIPKAPDEKTPVNPPDIELSTLEAELMISYSGITQKLNEVIPNQILPLKVYDIDPCPLTKCSYEFRVLRNGSISVNHDGNDNLVVNLPVRISDGSVDAMQKIWFHKIYFHASFTAEIVPIVTLNFTPMPNWSAVPEARVKFHVQTAKVQFRLPVLGYKEIPVQGITAGLLNSRRDWLQSIITDELKGKINFRSEALNVWKQLHFTQQLNDQPPLWLVADPVSLKAEKPRAKADGLRMAVGIDAYLSTHAQRNAPIPPKPEALPNLKTVSSTAGRYKLTVPILVSVEEANRQLKDLIGEKFTFEAAGRKIEAKLTDGHVYTNGPDLVAYAEVRAVKMLLGILPIRVGAYLNGTPKYDAESTTLKLNPFDYDADTNNLLLDKAEWFFHGNIRKNLQDALQFNIRKDIDDLRQLIARKLSDMVLDENVILNGTVDKLAPQAIYTDKDAINVNLLAEGTINIELK